MNEPDNIDNWGTRVAVQQTRNLLTSGDAK